jgi:hypothetical protein
MELLLLIVAWAAGLTSLFLVVDMIAADYAQRRAERLAARRVVVASPREEFRHIR